MTFGSAELCSVLWREVKSTAVLFLARQLTLFFFIPFVKKIATLVNETVFFRRALLWESLFEMLLSGSPRNLQKSHSFFLLIVTVCKDNLSTQKTL